MECVIGTVDAGRVKLCKDAFPKAILQHRAQMPDRGGYVPGMALEFLPELGGILGTNILSQDAA